MWILFILIPIVFIVGLVIFLSKNVSPTTARWHSYTSDTKGDFGELRVESVLGETVEGEKYVINNYTIEKDGKSSQIDHIFINQFGVFVIETKNYSGDIYGNDQQLKWTQVLNYGRIKNQFYNPVKQNASHIYKLRTILRLFKLSKM